MSEPKRGMVAGQPIQTQAQSKEWDEGYERVFGNGSKVRGKFRWDAERGEMVPIGSDWTDAERRAPAPTEELTYGGIKATDGTPINSRKKHREYLKQNGLAMSSDFSDSYREKVWADKERAQDKHRREAVERTWHQHTEGRRRGR